MSITLYHGSPNKNIKKLRDKSYVTIFPHIAYIMGLYYTDSGKTWTNNDLAKPYGFEPKIYFKKKRKPDGIPTLYAIKTNWDNIILHKNFPNEFLINKGIKTRKLTDNEIKKLISKSEKLYKCMSKLYSDIVYYY